MELMDRHGNNFDELVYDATNVQAYGSKNKLGKQAPVESERLVDRGLYAPRLAQLGDL